LKSQLDPINRHGDSLGQLLVKAKQNDKPSILILSNKTIDTRATKKIEISETAKGFLLNLDINTNQFSQFMSENSDLIQKVDILGFDLLFKDFIKNERYSKKYFYFNEIDIEIAALNSFLLQTIPYSKDICLVYSAENTPMYRQLINRYSPFFSCVDISNHNKNGLNNSNYKAFLVEGNTLSDKNLLNLKTKPNFIFSYKFTDVFYGLDEVKLIRLSGRKILDAYIDTLLSQNFNLNIDNYLRKFKEFTLVSGGLVGQNGNLIVNSVVLPTELVGVADGNGDFKELSNEEILGLSDFFDVLSSNKFDLLYGTD
jgi:hypothetical protein